MTFKEFQKKNNNFYNKSRTFVFLNNTKLTDIIGIEKFKFLDTLYIANNEIKDLSPLENLTHLTFIDISNNPIDNFDILLKFSKLSELHIKNIKFEGILSKYNDSTILIDNELKNFINQLNSIRRKKIISNIL